MPKGAPIFPRPDFVAGSRLNFAENLLYPANVNTDENSPAIIEATETGQSTVTWAQLRERVRQCALALQEQGVVESDRVAGFLGNHANAVIAMLAASSIGAIWTGVSPDTGVTAVLERLVQIEPKVLFVDNAVGYNGKVHGSYAKVKDILAGLKGLKACVMFETVKGFEVKTDGLTLPNGNVWKYKDFVKRLVMLLLLGSASLKWPTTASGIHQHPSNSTNYQHHIRCTYCIRVAQPEHQNASFIPQLVVSMSIP